MEEIMTPRKLTEDLPQMQEDLRNPYEKPRSLTEDLPQEDEDPDPRLLTEDC